MDKLNWSGLIVPRLNNIVRGSLLLVVALLLMTLAACGEGAVSDESEGVQSTAALTAAKLRLDHGTDSVLISEALGIPPDPPPAPRSHRAVFRRPQSADNTFVRWRNSIQQGDTTFRNAPMDLSVFDFEGHKLAVYRLIHPFPSALRLEVTTAGATQTVTEVLTVTYETFVQL